MASESQRKPLPFEPKNTPKKDSSNDKAPKEAAADSKERQRPSPRKASGKKATGAAASKGLNSRSTAESIPKIVSNRMIRRMAFFCGIPTLLAMGIFVGSYFLLTRHIFEFPKVVGLLSTLGCFGLGVLGLSYGVLSASWEEDVEGSLLGTAEFSVNFKRMVQSMREAKQNKEPS